MARLSPGKRDLYLKRLQYDGSAAASTDTLVKLHHLHMEHVPFENLSIHSREPIVLDEAALFDKIVLRRRGGFCYELNGLFAVLLEALGFRVQRLAARVFGDDGELGIPFAHMCLRVEGEDTRLADVGFGDSFRSPLPFDRSEWQEDEAGRFRLEQAGEDRQLVQALPDGSGKPLFRFALDPHPLSDFEPACRYHQTSPDSHFTWRRVCTRATPDGRITLSGRRLIVRSAAGRAERELEDDASVREVLRESFGIMWPA